MTRIDTDDVVLGTEAAFLSWAIDDLPPDKFTNAYRVSLWHTGQCAICGLFGDVLVDHDHASHLTRGMLCKSCNAREGKGHDGVYQAWREGQNPGTVYALAEEYWSSRSVMEYLPTSVESLRIGAEAAGRIG